MMFCRSNTYTCISPLRRRTTYYLDGFAGFGGFDDVLRVAANPENPLVAENWHTDASWKQVPPKYTVLLARQMPSVGGDTLFASQYKAYEDLSDAMKAFIEPLDARHDGRIIDPMFSKDSVIHPIVITHPETGRKALYVNANYTQSVVQLEPREGKALLEFLFAHCTRERYQARVRYEPGTLAIWDQRCMQHAAAADFLGARELHRIAVLGDAPPSRCASKLCALALLNQLFDTIEFAYIDDPGGQRDGCGDWEEVNPTNL